MSVTPADSRYPIPAISPEKERLSKLYAMKKTVYGWSTAVPDGVELSEVDSVIDVGAGTCMWTLDLLSMAEVKARRDKMRIHVCDINPSFFPESIPDWGVTAFQQDVTKPFPEELYGTFDLVHASFLVGCLTSDGWNSALANYYKLLKPHGILILDETDPIFLPDAEQIESIGEDLNKWVTGNSWIAKANCVYTISSLKKEFDIRITSHLGAMLEDSGFRIEQSKLGAMAIGPLCRSTLGVNGASQTGYEEFSLENAELVLSHIAAGMLKAGILDAPQGRLINEEVEMKKLLTEIGDGMRTEGAVVRVSYFVARK